MTAIAKKRVLSRLTRHARIRKKVSGTAERPRLAVRRTLNNLIVQILDDSANRSLLQMTTSAKEFQAQYGSLTKTEQCRKLGTLIGEAAKAKGVLAVVFDRGGYIYHGRVQALAEGAREGGLQF